jgi:hypothetical protein
MDAFEQAALRRFEDELVEQLGKFAPKHVTAMGESNLRKVIQTGIERARKHGYTLRGPVRFFIELMILFGSDFDTDPVLPWASQYLRAPARGDELSRADQLHGVVVDYMNAVFGPNYEREAAAIRRLLDRPVSAWLGGEVSDSWAAMRQVYPEKCERADAVAAAAVLQAARRAAGEHLLPAGSGGLVCAALMVAFGHGCLTDPQFPWIAANLRVTSGQAPEKRVEKLAIRALAYLSEGLLELERG